MSAFPTPPSPDSFPAEVSFPSASSPESQATQESSDAAIPASVSAVTFDLSSLPSVQAFAASLELVATEARQRYDELNRQFNEASMQHAREVADRFAEVLPGIHSELEALRSAAQAGAAQIQADAEADREASVSLRESSQAEADAVLDQARREAEHIIAPARAEGDAGRQELASPGRAPRGRGAAPGAAERHRFALPPCPQRRRRPERSALVGDVGRLREGSAAGRHPAPGRSELLPRRRPGARRRRCPRRRVNRPSDLPVAEPLPGWADYTGTCRCSSSAGPWPSAR